MPPLHQLVVQVEDALAPTAQNVPLFVYGTLMTDLPNHALFNLSVNSLSIQPVTLPGHQMYSLNDWYPVILPSSHPKDVVYGEAITLKPAVHNSLIMKLDGLEGYRGDDDPSSSYVRRKALARTKDGEEVEVEYYRWNQPISEYCSRVEHGDWKRLIREL
ncbi:hypothetical protein SpCBS45565_g07417 [Spizellomyces sp. 'palustris']|nr:hypothetical protein SpCBS45565_g07417 [Spizellomyces sp. 'palustris']